MAKKILTLKLLKGKYGVCRLNKTQSIPEWSKKGEFFSITKTSDELSIVCFEDNIPNDIKCEKNWRVLKIEGRGRSAEYVKTVTKTYKQAVKAYFDGEFTQENKDKWNKELSKVYNRGFWDGYYLGQTIGEWTEKYGSRATKVKEFIGTITNYFKDINVAEVRLETGELTIGDDIIILGKTTGVYEDTIKEIRVDLLSVEKAVKGDMFSIPTHEIIRRGDKLYKIKDAEI